MKILSVTALALPGIKVIRFARFRDHRGYFTELFRRSDFHSHPELSEFKNLEFVQSNESHSRPRVIRGLHFQWNPFMGKLVRTLTGRMIDIVLDVRKGSPTLGRAIMYDMPSDPACEWSEWIWVPPGFAHGNCFPIESTIEYCCTGEYNQAGEGGISPLAADIDWSICDPSLRGTLESLVADSAVIGDKDRDAPSLGAWLNDPRSDHFRYSA